jgi:hypothetical protein
MGLAIKIGNTIYRDIELRGKTLYASRKLPIYNTYRSVNPSSYVAENTPVGIYQGYVANGYKGAKRSYIIIGSNTQNTKVVPYDSTYFSSYALDSQGTKSASEEKKTDEQENRPWYQKITGTLAPWIVGLIAFGIYIKNKK